jgi:hypothetical protein
MTLKENGLRVTENWMPIRLHGPKREEVAGGCRRLHNEELLKVYS